MRKLIYFITYLAALALGVTLLIFNHQTLEDERPVLHIAMIAAGVIFVVPGIVLLLASLRAGSAKGGNRRPVLSTILGVASLVWGVLILVMPDGLLGRLNITLGVSLFIAAFAQIVWIVRGRRANGAPLWIYLLPLAVAVAGVAVIMLPTDWENPGAESRTGCIVSGIAFTLWAINGFLSLSRRRPAPVAKQAPATPEITAASPSGTQETEPGSPKETPEDAPEINAGKEGKEEKDANKEIKTE